MNLRNLLPAALPLALAFGATPALAGTAPAPAPASAPAPTVEPLDAARLAAAETTVDYIFPNGTYARIMDKTTDMVMGTMMDSVGKMSLRDVAAMGGLPQDKAEELGEATLKEIMAIYDPAYEQRMQATMTVMMGEMKTIMTRFEPSIRSGLAQAYARRFTVSQLGEMNAFFATPTGKAYAADAMVIFMDPAVMAKMQEFMPVFMKEMPAIMAKVQAATASLPAPRKYADLSEAEKRRIAATIGVKVEELGKPRDGGLVEVK